MPNKAGARSIHTAARKGHVGIINTLLQKGEHVDVTTNVRENNLTSNLEAASCQQTFHSLFCLEKMKSFKFLRYATNIQIF